MDGLKSNAGGFNYKLDEVNIAEIWDPTTLEPEQMGGFNFGTEDKILRWLHRGDTIYDVIIPEDAEVVLCDEEKGIYRANKIIVSNPRTITDEMGGTFFKKIVRELTEKKPYYQTVVKGEIVSYIAIIVLLN